MEDAPIERYLELAAAVVETAVNDYVTAKKRLPRLQKKAEKEKAQLEALKKRLSYTLNKLSATERDITAKKRLPRLQKKAEKEKAQLEALKKRLSYTLNKLSATERDIEECRTFFLSDRFDVFMPNVDGDKFLELLDAKIEYEMNPENISNELDTQGS